MGEAGHPLADCTAGRHRSETRHLAVSPLHLQVMLLLLPPPPAVGTAVNFLAMVTSPDLESLSCAHCNPPNTPGDGVYHAHITDGTGEAHRKAETWPWSHSHLGIGLQLKSWGPEWPHWEGFQGPDVEREA